jgi:cysteine-rich repeat protein
MRGARGVVATVMLVAIAACGRSSLRKQSYSGDHTSPTVTGTGGAIVVTGGATGAGGSAAVGTGGSVGASIPGTGGLRATGGELGAGGRDVIGGSSTTSTRGGGGALGNGGAVGAGGRLAVGGSYASGGVVGTGGHGAGGVSVGPGGSVVGGALGTGGRVGTGGAGTGGIVAVGGSSTGGTFGAGGSSARGGVNGGGGVAGNAGIAGSSSLGGAGAAGGRCGDGTVDPGELCDLGADNAPSPALWVSQGDFGFGAVPMIGGGSVSKFYQYSSASAHTGFESMGTSRILFYLDRATRALSLVFFHGIDQDSSGIEQPAARVQFLFTGLPDSTVVGQSDDADELIMTSTTAATGFWKFTNNSDGGALSNLPLPGDWKIKLEPSFIEGISVWTWVQADGSMFSLDLSKPVTIEARSEHSQCRSDCTIAQCGDGILDAGELCDDGQPSTSGCSLNCMSFN